MKMKNQEITGGEYIDLFCFVFFLKEILSPASQSTELWKNRREQGGAR